MEYLKHGVLLNYITNIENNENIGFGENFGRLIFSQLLDGLEAIHNLNICHRDIKLNNIFLSEDNYILKYVDFGKAMEIQSKLQDFLGTSYYTAKVNYKIYLKLLITLLLKYFSGDLIMENLEIFFH